ncbi:uncharacterized protein LOC129591590 [Paramacrobiotus metropolitanus]|uniref:uncharacterized protein LOC129591590 n=1 Tax=Paramacrobiotus metropolitanus TaxID=2943436 RepID=UPI002446314E|nr:uncharacterized protein LOC129591590 [Paramacrobiotus metropolitanus]
MLGAWLSVCCFVVLVGYLVTRSNCTHFTVEIITPGMIRAFGMSNLPLTGPAMDLGLEHIQKIYAEFFSVKQTYIFNHSFATCDDAADGFHFMLSDYYYRRRLNSTIVVFAYPGGTAGIVASVISQAIAGQIQATPHAAAYFTTVDSSKSQSFATVLQEIKKTARIVMFFGHADILRNFMIQAAQNNMTDGDYVYITMTPYEYFTSLYGNVTWQNYDEWDEIAFAAYRSLLLVIPSPSSPAARRTRESLYPELIRRSKADYNYTYRQNDVPTPIAITQYACMRMLGMVINATLSTLTSSDSIIPESGFMAKWFWNRTVETPVGTISFDEVGERQIQLEVQQLNFSTGNFEPVMIQDAATFWLKPIKPVEWFSGEMPLDMPECGFSGKTGPCAESSRRNIFEIVGGVLLFVAATVIVLRYWPGSTL